MLVYAPGLARGMLPIVSATSYSVRTGCIQETKENLGALSTERLGGEGNALSLKVKHMPWAGTHRAACRSLAAYAWVLQLARGRDTVAA